MNGAVYRERHDRQSSGRLLRNAFASLRCVWRRWWIARGRPFREAPPGAAIIVAPHPDDETFGCGNLIADKREAGIRVTIVFLTDGESVSGGLRDDRQIIIETRRRQAIMACQELGVEAEDIRWLHLPDGRLPHPQGEGFLGAVDLMYAELARLPGAEIYCPHPLDHHPDHVASAHIVREAARRATQRHRVVYYTVWMWYSSPIGLSSRLPLSESWQLAAARVHSRKRAAVGVYLSGPKTSLGTPFCGSLPRAFLWNVNHRPELYFG